MAAVAADAAIAAVKFAGGALSGSAVMMAEGIHSIVDGASASLLLVGERRARRPATRRHPFGHGKEVYFWTVVVAMLGFVLGGGFAILEGVLAWHEGAQRRQWFNFVVLGAAFAFNAVSLGIAVRELKRYQRDKGYGGSLIGVMRQSHNPPMFVVVLADSAALAGIVVAAAGVALSLAWHSPIVDAAASIVDGAIMMAVALILGWEARSLIVGEAARPPLVRDARRVIEGHRAIAALDELRSLQLGADDVMLVVHARFADGVRTGDLPRVSRDLETRLRAQHPSIKHVLFDFDDRD